MPKPLQKVERLKHLGDASVGDERFYVELPCILGQAC